MTVCDQFTGEHCTQPEDNMNIITPQACCLLLMLVLGSQAAPAPKPHFLVPQPNVVIQPHVLLHSSTPPLFHRAPHSPIVLRASVPNEVTPSEPAQGPVRILFFSFSRFPWPLENWVQRLQNYFSTYTTLPIEPVVAGEIDLGPDVVPPDELEPETDSSHPASSPAIMAVELPNPSWSNQPSMSSSESGNKDSVVTDKPLSTSQKPTAVIVTATDKPELPSPSWPSVEDTNTSSSEVSETTAEETTVESTEKNETFSTALLNEETLTTHATEQINEIK